MPRWNESIIVPIYTKGDITVVIKEEHHCSQHTKFYPVFFSED
jgi:hypothetical protein